ncbi:hypothetical protein, partial [Corynebacterium glyciniphilum]|uniref:hypothetical protein n=1 Tax=Corynebacterium glyciniphilum TaxID=1404244 RepID=UPI001C930D5B
MVVNKLCKGGVGSEEEGEGMEREGVVKGVGVGGVGEGEEMGGGGVWLWRDGGRLVRGAGVGVE